MWDLRHRRNRAREQKSEEQEEAFLEEGGGSVKSVSCVKSGDLQRKAQLKLCIGCCASRS